MTQREMVVVALRECGYTEEEIAAEIKATDKFVAHQAGEHVNIAAGLDRHLSPEEERARIDWLKKIIKATDVLKAANPEMAYLLGNDVLQQLHNRRQQN